MGALLFILLTAILSVLGYLVIPDSTPFANDQQLRLATLKPGTSVSMLYVRKNTRIDKKGFLAKMLFGEKSSYEKVPFTEYYFENDKIVLNEFSNNLVTRGRLYKFNLADVAFALNPEIKPIVTDDNKILYTTLEGDHKIALIKSLQSHVEDHNIRVKTFLLGTDRFGRDLLSRLVIGARVSLSVGFISVFISLVIGISLGAIAGFFRGWLDDFIIWFINVVWSIPTLLLVIAITFALGKGFWQVFIAVGLTMWVEVARVVRGQIISLREKEFVEAGRALGFSNFRIVYRHILPNVLSPVIVISAANFAAAILIEAGLSFLGIGVQPPMPSWGSMIKEHYGYLILDSAYLAILPGIAIVLMVLAFMLIGNALRDALDVKTA